MTLLLWKWRGKQKQNRKRAPQASLWKLLVHEKSHLYANRPPECSAPCCGKSFCSSLEKLEKWRFMEPCLKDSWGKYETQKEFHQQMLSTRAFWERCGCVAKVHVRFHCLKWGKKHIDHSKRVRQRDRERVVHQICILRVLFVFFLIYYLLFIYLYCICLYKRLLGDRHVIAPGMFKLSGHAVKLVVGARTKTRFHFILN